MTKEEIQMMNDIIDTECVGYAYAYLRNGAKRKEYFLSLKPEYLAGFIAEYGMHADRMMITDMVDREVVSTRLWFLERCANDAFRNDLTKYLEPIQMGDEKAGKVLVIDRKTADQYFALEAQQKSMMECSVEMR